jgi:hypothetical protein
MKLGPQRIGAHTDCGLQIFLPQDPGKSEVWDRSCCEIGPRGILPFPAVLIFGKPIFAR